MIVTQSPLHHLALPREINTDYNNNVVCQRKTMIVAQLGYHYDLLLCQRKNYDCDTITIMTCCFVKEKQ